MRERIYIKLTGVLGQGLVVSVQLKKFPNIFRSFGIFSEIVTVTLFSGHTVLNSNLKMCVLTLL